MKTTSLRLLVTIAVLFSFAVPIYQSSASAAITTPSISKVTDKVSAGKPSSLRIEGQNFDPATVEVVIFGGRCTAGCVVPNDVLGENGGAVTSTLLGAVPVTIMHAGEFEAAVRNGPQGELSNRAKFKSE